MNARSLHFANSAIQVTADGELAGHVVRYLFDYIPAAGPAAPHFVYRLAQEDGAGEPRLALSGDDPTEPPRSSGLAQTAVYLMDRAGYHLADQSQGGLMFHAACVHRGGGALLLPAPSGSGKSSLALWLVEAGYDYMTDELAFIPEGTLDVQGFSRPVYIKRSGLALFPEVLARMGQQQDLIESPGGVLAPPGLLGGGRVVPMAPLRCMVLPRYTSGAALHLHRLSKARAALALTRCLINARNLPDNGFPELLRLAQAVPIYELSYGGFDQLGTTLDDLMEAPDGPNQ